MINFLHTYLPQRILFHYGWLQIHWYGVLIVLAILAGLAIVLRLAKFYQIKSEQVYDLGFYIIIFSLLGARIYAIFLDWNYYWQNPFEIIAVWHGGLAIHGAILGGVITLLIYTHPLTRPSATLSPQGARGIGSFWLWADLIAPALALGQAIGRWGNYFNQENFGKPTNLPWGIPIDVLNRPFQYLNYQYFQPTFLYESALDFLNFILVLFLWILVNRKKQAGKLASWQAGLIFLVYLINYSLIRISMEFLRVDQTPIILGIRWPIIISFGIMLASLALLIKNIKWQNQNSKLNPKS